MRAGRDLEDLEIERKGGGIQAQIGWRTSRLSPEMRRGLRSVKGRRVSDPSHLKCWTPAVCLVVMYKYLLSAKMQRRLLFLPILSEGMRGALRDLRKVSIA